MLTIIFWDNGWTSFFLSKKPPCVIPPPEEIMNQPLQNKSLPMPSLRNIQAFIEVADTGSLNLAAENLNITASAVSHQIASLEQYLGKRYFPVAVKGWY
ncbi:transcriptional regulator [Klebsiella michiganensis]|uniref:Transcriptional regulator n=1 Tax=Klebsiella michiganensis TaxID=1134687 RepID=A0A7H4LWU1_9ENTR|nr:transcriptional regulator [Klebsiella michiganensis]